MGNRGSDSCGGGCRAIEPAEAIVVDVVISAGLVSGVRAGEARRTTRGEVRGCAIGPALRDILL
ncbi:hypothetical protein I7I48_01463 [Histoplasma ohiense]|nr:hypothetical protein I7I48_01463 [Histoplasma ohiense (nom. inval.)]